MLVVADVNGNPVQPGARIAADCAAMAEQAHEDFLSGVTRVFEIAQQPPCCAQYHRLVLGDEDIEAFSGAPRGESKRQR